jgi:hypothetical protein
LLLSRNLLTYYSSIRFLHAIAENQPSPSNRTKFRWVVCTLLLFATAINYIDRQVIGLLKPMLQRQFGFDEHDYASTQISGAGSAVSGTMRVCGKPLRMRVRFQTKTAQKQK